VSTSVSGLELAETLVEDKSGGRRAAFWELTKPKISAMVLISIVVSGLVAASGTPGLWPLLHVAVGMFLVAASGNAMNMYLERYTDPLMARTAKRPLPDRRLSSLDVLNFGAITFGAGFSYLLTTLNWQTALCAGITWVLYVFVYTPLKTRTWLNTEVGAVAGALPIFSGALATTGTLNWQAWGFFLVLLFWQFPHFMAIAWLYREQYATGGLQMLTVVDPTGNRAGRKAVVTAVITWLVSLMPAVIIAPLWAAILFGVLATLAAWLYFQAAVQFQRSRTDQTARRLLRVSVLYLPLYMLLLVIFSRLTS
jgi:protoheme IX farnesyltransferase